MATVQYSQVKRNIAVSTAEPVTVNDGRSAVSPMQLDTIDLADYVLKLIEKGVTTEELVRCLEGEYSLAAAFLHMFDEMRWISKQGENWTLTTLGKANIFRFQRRT